MVDDFIDDTVSLTKRHGSSHYANIKYGYAVLGLSLLYLAYRELALFYYHRAWEKSGRSTSKLGLVNIPIQYFATILFLLMLILSLFNMDLDNFGGQLKRFGRIAYSLTPLNIFLAIRPSPFHLDNYLDTLQLHLWSSRVILFFTLAHGVGYFVKWGTSEFYKTFRLLNFIGVLAFVLVSVLAVINWRPIRRRWYRYFYIFHNVTAYFYILAIGFHARPGVTPIAVLNILLLIYLLVMKYKDLHQIRVTEIVEEEGSDLKIVRIPRGSAPESYLPGGHCRLSARPKTIWDWNWLFPSHPYTITGVVDREDGQMNLIVKEKTFEVVPFGDYDLQSYFSSSLSINFFHTAENINIVCGGSGISYGIPIFEYFKEKIDNGSTDIHLQFVWIISNEEDLFVVRHLRISGVEIYVTSEKNGNSDPIDDVDSGAASAVGTNGISERGIELDAIDSTADGGESFASKKTFENVVRFVGRPNLGSILAGNMAATIDYANKWIIVCGPDELVSDCREIAERHKCRFFSEEYAM
ncbi:DEKNAAC105541 [Brettanomyces naardenensis]|uniref:DEKNAAC105541 n=1 Tax=Brettanomyces naardenensis TaxID=13370 RepID=A0A448YTZ0_BRENA|nr:DEKNAAC105541 [Brettanomyces naardenensis]